MLIAVFEPMAIPGLDRAILELVLVFGFAASLLLLLTVSSIVGIIRSIRRRRHGAHSRAAICWAMAAASITTLWLLYWVGDNLYRRVNPLDALLAINLGLCVLPFCWLVTGIRANMSAGRPDHGRLTKKKSNLFPHTE